MKEEVKFSGLESHTGFHGSPRLPGEGGWMGTIHRVTAHPGSSITPTKIKMSRLSRVFTTIQSTGFNGQEDGELWPSGAGPGWEVGWAGSGS